MTQPPLQLVSSTVTSGQTSSKISNTTPRQGPAARPTTSSFELNQTRQSVPDDDIDVETPKQALAARDSNVKAEAALPIAK